MTIIRGISFKEDSYKYLERIVKAERTNFSAYIDKLIQKDMKENDLEDVDTTPAGHLIHALGLDNE